MSEKPDAKQAGLKESGAQRQQPQKDIRQKGARQSQQAAKPMVSASGREVRGVVRLAGRDLRGSLPISRAITSVRGIGINLGNVISQIAYSQLNISEKTMLGELSEQEVEKLEHILKNPAQYGVPSWMLNRQKDLLSGTDQHLIGSDLAYAVKLDIDHEKEANTWRGYRHFYGQKVRGQHTRSTGRTGMTVGVLRKSVLQKAGAAAAAQTGAAAQQQAAGAAQAGKAQAKPAPAAKPAAAKPAAGAPAAKPAEKPQQKK